MNVIPGCLFLLFYLQIWYLLNAHAYFVYFFLLFNVLIYVSYIEQFENWLIDLFLKLVFFYFRIYISWLNYSLLKFWSYFWTSSYFASAILLYLVRYRMWLACLWPTQVHFETLLCYFNFFQIDFSNRQFFWDGNIRV